MKLTLLVAASGLALTCAEPASSHWHTWSPPGKGDVRAPCPMLNTLANHGFLPHDGHNITVDKTIMALYSALHVNQSLSHNLFEAAVQTNPEPNATYFDLDHLSRHNILEHDASLSRGDAYFGDDHTFNQTVFDQTRSYWTEPIIDIQMAANARLARVQTSNSTNPTFGLSDVGVAFSFGETAAYIIALGDPKSGTVKRPLVEYLFEHERLPLALGWTRPENLITSEVLNTVTDRVVNATGASPDQAKLMLRNAGIHGGMSVAPRNA